MTSTDSGVDKGVHARMVAMSSMNLTDAPGREASEEVGSLTALRPQLSKQVRETVAAKRELAALTAYMTDQMAPMVDKMAKKAQYIAHQLEVKEANIKQLTLHCQQTEAALQSSVEVINIVHVH